MGGFTRDELSIFKDNHHLTQIQLKHERSLTKLCRLEKKALQVWYLCNKFVKGNPYAFPMRKKAKNH